MLYTYIKRFVCFAESVFSMTRRVIAESVSAASSVFAESVLPNQFLPSLTRRVIADLDFVYSCVCVCVYNKRMKYTSKRRDIFDPYSKAQYMYSTCIVQ